MNATEVLMREHDAITLMLEIMDHACTRLEGGKSVPVAHLEQMLDFLKTFADGCHHMKEEQTLFPALERAGIPREHGPIGVMLAEHELGRKYISGMTDALRRLAGGDSSAAGPFIRDSRAYGNLLRGHILKENTVLFRLADDRLRDGEQEQILKEFDRIETEKVGAGKHEEYHALLKTLAGTYLR